MRKKNGGKVIASGGFGCVFRPALMCKGQTRRDKDKITKLMIKKYAIEEYEDVIKYTHILKKIPSYHNYFLIDGFHLCDPAPLNYEDMKYFKDKCTALPKKDIDKTNINVSLDQLLALNMPDGGLALDDFLSNSGSYHNIVKINDTLINLLLKGIIPMNKNHIYHCDVKDSNILVQKSKNELYTRLIDWGLSTVYNPDKSQRLPKTWQNRPFQFNTPFSIIIFSDKFTVKYKSFLDEHPINHANSKEELKKFIVNYIYYWLKERGIGHFKFINTIINKLFFTNIPPNITEKKLKNKFIIEKYTIPIITEYIYNILIHFTERSPNGDIDFRKYLNNVFIKIVDVYGFISCYYPVLEIYYENYQILSKNELTIFERVRNIFIKYLYEPCIKEYNISEITKDLKNLNSFFLLEEHLHAKPFSLLSKTFSSSKKKKTSTGRKTRKNRI